MSLEEIKAIAQRWQEEVFNKRNLNAIDELLDTDYVLHTTNIRGIAAAKEQFSKIIRDSPDLHATMEDIIAEGDKVAYRWTWREGGKVSSTGITILRIVDGKIVEDWYCSSQMSEESGE